MKQKIKQRFKACKIYYSKKYLKNDDSKNDTQKVFCNDYENKPKKIIISLSINAHYKYENYRATCFHDTLGHVIQRLTQLPKYFNMGE